MGLDIQLSTDNEEQLFTPDYFSDGKDYFNKHSLSRTFCNFMCRPNVISGEPELDQIGRITGTDINPIKDMEKYWDEDNIESQLSFADNETERQEILRRINDDRKSVENNIDKVHETISDLISKLSTIDNLPTLLSDNGWDSLNNETYFADFNVDKGEGYIGNNFGQDLRNFIRFIEYAKAHGSKTIYFRYG
jgi:hypothetical protein